MRSRPKGTGEPVLVRLQPELAKPLDDWRRRQTDLPSRAEAIRRLTQQALKAKRKAPTPAPPPGKPR
jgi:metal-responsive CopG/Arc/MetJ family transcriptional regulator